MSMDAVSALLGGADDQPEQNGQVGGDAGLLDGLTEPQKRAAETTEGPVLVLAAAGSGKTRVITRRAALLIENGVPPWEILAITFTNKAAAEMRERVFALLGGEESRKTRGLTISTFHSLCARLLRRYAEQAELPGLKPDYSIYDSSDQVALIKRCLTGLDLSTTNWPPRSVLSAISGAKNELVDAEAYAKGAMDYSPRTIAKIYASYQRGLREAGAVDFDDLLMLTAKMLAERPEIRAECQARWRYIMIDEYQDTNGAQFQIASLLAGTPEERGGPPNICVVGDPDQAIYGWRGADIGNILDFEDRFPGATVIPLGENFRSTAPILGAADTLIRRNQRRKHKDLYTSRDGGDQVEVVLCRDEHHEAQLVGDWVRARSEDGLKWKDMAVFYRTNALSRVIEEELRRSGIPYVLVRGTAFYQREEVKHALGYLRVVANLADEVSLLRIVNTPTRGIGKAGLAAAELFARDRRVTLFEALRRADEIDGLSGRARNAMVDFARMVDGWTGAGSFMGQTVPGSLPELVERIIRESGLEGMYKKQAAKDPAQEERLENLEELVSSASTFEEDYDPENDPMRFDEAVAKMNEGSVAAPETPPLLEMVRAYLESVSLVADSDAVDPDRGAVQLMTLHAAKGLEFPAVAMLGLEENVLPHSRAAMSDSEMEEERRLCFVGITRAMKRLIMTSARYRTMRGRHERTIPSRFLEELGSEHAVFSDQSDSLGNFGDGSATDAWERDLPVHQLRELSSQDEVRRSNEGDKRASGLKKGTRVRHARFGVGTIISVTGGANARAQIEFNQVGTKTLVLEYARLEILP